MIHLGCMARPSSSALGWRSRGRQNQDPTNGSGWILSPDLRTPRRSHKKEREQIDWDPDSGSHSGPEHGSDETQEPAAQKVYVLVWYIPGPSKGSLDPCFGTQVASIQLHGLFGMATPPEMARWGSATLKHPSGPNGP